MGSARGEALRTGTIEPQHGGGAPAPAAEHPELLPERIPVGIYETDPEGRCTFVNERWCALAGLAADESLGYGWMRALHPDDREPVISAWDEATASGGDFHCEYRLIRADGSEVRVLGAATPVHDESGAVVSYLGSCADITGYRRLEAHGAIQEQRFSNSFDHAPIGIALVSPAGRFLRVNRAVCDLTGYAEGELLAKTFQDITHPDDLERDLEQVRSILAGEITTYQMEKRYFRADGETIWVLLAVSLVRGEDDTPLYFISQIQDITERKNYERDLRDLADHDGLTGLLNRRRFSLELRRELDRVKQHGRSAALIFVDLDDFKGINDSLGHKAGDDLIRMVGAALAAKVRHSDVLARLGGDEFGVLITDTDLAGAEVFAAEIAKTVNSVEMTVGDETVRVTASLGLTLLGEGATSEDDLLIAADLAMYEAKREGRDRVAIHGVDRTAIGPQRQVAWSDRIRSALEGDGMLLHYQPILDLRTGAVPIHEALIRMRGEDGELIPPGAFLGVADHYGMSLSIDRWVIGRAIEAVADGKLPAGGRVCVNISARTLNHPEVLLDLERLLGSRGVAPEQLIVEITETAAIEHVAKAKRFASRLTRLGCSLALDDFGTGFSSFYYLKHLPCGYLKIDGEFIRSLRASPIDRLLVKSVVDIARALGKLTVAEFVGDDRTLEILRELGVDYAQGFHVGRPVPADELAATP